MATMRDMRKMIALVTILAGCSGGSGLAAADSPDVGEQQHDSGAETTVSEASEPEPDSGEPEDTGHRCDDVAYLPCDCDDGTQGRMPCAEDLSHWSHCSCEPDAGGPDAGPLDSGSDAADSAQDAAHDSGAQDTGADAECVYQQVVAPKTIADSGITVAKGDCAKFDGTLVVNDPSRKAVCRTYCDHLGCAAFFLAEVVYGQFTCQFNSNQGPSGRLEYYCLICK